MERENEKRESVCVCVRERERERERGREGRGGEIVISNNPIFENRLINLYETLASSSL